MTTSTTTKTKKEVNIIDSIRSMISKNLTEDQKKDYGRLAEKFHQSFDVDKTQVKNHDVKEIALEECLAYLVESLKSGLHPKHTTKTERNLIEAHFGKEWYKHFEYDRDELEGEKDSSGDFIL
jgi:hypothetical protein